MAAKVQKIIFIEHEKCGFSKYYASFSVDISVGKRIFAGLIQKSEDMKIRKITLGLFFAALFVSLTAQAQEASPTATILEENGELVEEPTILSGGDSYTASAPLVVKFQANVEEKEGYTYAYEWSIYPMDTPEAPLLRRYEADTEYTFTASGTFGIRFYITYSTGEGETELEEEYDPITIVISESSLHVPNAFSPNGDGINDVFKVSYKSLVKFDAYIFNRWGQRLYHWGLSDIDNGWDGTYNGSQVKDGVYFIVVNAVGSDGVKYNVKQDVNILRGYTGSSSGSVTE